MSNSLTISLTAIVASAAAAPSLCRVSGYVRDVSGTVLPGVIIRVRHCYKPMTADGDSLILRERREFKTDSNGFVQFDVYRESTVHVTLDNREDLTLERDVPDASSIDLVAWLFPYIVSTVLDNPTPIALEVGGTESLTLTATMSDLTTVTVPSSALTVTMGNSAISSVASGVLLGVAAGSTTATITDIDQSFLDSNKEPDDDPIVHISQPAPTLPGAITVNVT